VSKLRSNEKGGQDRGRRKRDLEGPLRIEGCRSPLGGRVVLRQCVLFSGEVGWGKKGNLHEAITGAGGDLGFRRGGEKTGGNSLVRLFTGKLGDGAESCVYGRAYSTWRLRRWEERSRLKRLC